MIPNKLVLLLQLHDGEGKKKSCVFWYTLVPSDSTRCWPRGGQMWCRCRKSTSWVEVGKGKGEVEGVVCCVRWWCVLLLLELKATRADSAPSVAFTSIGIGLVGFIESLSFPSLFFLSLFFLLPFFFSFSSLFFSFLSFFPFLKLSISSISLPVFAFQSWTVRARRPSARTVARDASCTGARRFGARTVARDAACTGAEPAGSPGDLGP